MPPKKGTSTPNKPPENPTWTLDEGEEMCRDINDLQNKIVTKDELQEMMEGLKGEIMEVLKNFVTEKTLKVKMHPMKFMMRTQGR
jgi:hypothetical protein